MLVLGDFPVGSTIRFMWDTFDQTGANILPSTAGTINYYKDGSTTKRSSLSGITDTRTFNSLTGIHISTIDTTDNTDAGFWAAGSVYFAILEGAVIDTKTVNKVLARFSIEKFPPFTAIATTPTAGSIASIIKRLPDIAAGANGGLPTTNGTKLNQTVDLVASQLFIKKNTALANFEFVMYDSADHVTPKTGLTVTCQRSIDGGAFANCNTATATEVSAGVYKVDLAASDLNGTVIMLKFNAAGADTAYLEIVTQA